MRKLAFIITLLTAVPVFADIFYTRSEYEELENEKYALELDLKFLNERFINERFQMNRKADELSSKIAGLSKDLQTLQETRNTENRESAGRIAELESRVKNLEKELANLKQEKTESERVSALRIADLESQLSALHQTASARERELLTDNENARRKYLAEIQSLRDQLARERDEHRALISASDRQWQEKLDAASKKLSDASEQIAKLTAENEQLKNRINELTAQTAEQRRQLSSLTDQAKNLEDKLQKEIQEGSLRLRRLNDRLIINMDNKILFDSGSAVLRSAEVRATLDKISEILSKYPDNEILVEGHTDNVPIQTAQFRDNWQLSTERALSVLGHLLRNRNVDPSKITAVGAGQFHPVVPNDTAENRSLNRRVDIVVIPKSVQGH